MTNATQKPLTLVALHERDMGLFQNQVTAGTNGLILVVDTPDMFNLMRKWGNDPRIIQMLKMDSPTGPSSEDGRRLKAMIASGRIQAAEVWRNSPVAPLAFNKSFTTPNLMLAYESYRFLRYAGFENITIRAQDWVEMIPPIDLLDNYVNRHKGERCFVMGNGPSLNDIDMSRLKDEVTFGSNRVFLGFEKWGFEVNYWGIEDRLQVEEYHGEYAEGLSDSIPKFVPFDYLTYSRMPGTVYFPLLYGNGRTYPNGMTYPVFSDRPDRTYHGFTITYSLIQLAALMGFSEIYLIGIDHNYGLQADKLALTSAGSDGKTWAATDAGTATHFDTRYTTNAKQFIKPRPINAEVAYACAQQWHDVNGRIIRNATPGTHLDVVETVDYDSLF